jgi:predicted NodU family carbamoyl transferase
MKIIGIHDGHNASVAYVEDGCLKFAIQEERPHQKLLGLSSQVS